MEENERWFAAKTLLLKIHAITGWTIPISEMMDILVDQFQRKLQEGYSKVTIGEIEYAFRNKGIDIKDWGKAMNLALFDEVMIPYLENRFELSRLEESIKTKASMQIEDKRQLTDEEKAEWMMDWKVMEDINIELIPLIFYEFLDGKNQKGEKILTLPTKKKNEYLELAAQQIKTQLFDDIATCKTNDAYVAFNKFENMEKTGFTGEFKGRILNRAKRLIVFDYLKDKIV